MRVMVCELDADGGMLDAGWARVVGHAHRYGPELAVLPELPFAPWLPATDEVDPAAWADAVAAHDRWLERLPELGATVVVASRPTVVDGHRFNEGFVWVAGEGIVGSRTKTFLPDEEGFHEATWYQRGPVRFDPVATPVGQIGVLLCTELWFPEHARALGQAGVGLLAAPRATPFESLHRWEAVARVDAITAGAYLLTANRSGRAGPTRLGGGGWVVDPDGEVLARTTPGTPAVTVEIDLALPRAARSSYPRYVDDSPRGDGVPRRSSPAPAVRPPP
jgi:N-carbamoylputrescine amidase